MTLPKRTATDWHTNGWIRVGDQDVPVIAVRWTGDNLFELRSALGVRGLHETADGLVIVCPPDTFTTVPVGDWVVADPRPGRFHILPGSWALRPYLVVGSRAAETRRRLAAIARRDGTSRCHLCGLALIDVRPAPHRFIAFDSRRALPPSWPTIDHVIPRGKGGLDRLENLKMACATCNYEKGDMMPTEYRSDAYLSGDRTYRYTLHRRWGGGAGMLWVMCNPSTADAETDDPTIRRCMAFAKAWGYGALTVVNLWALRASKPGKLWTHDDPCGPENTEIVAREVAAHDLVVAAWGAWPGGQPPRKAIEVLDVAAMPTHPDSPGLRCLGTTISGAPRHPLYVKGDVELQPWP